MDQLFLLQSVSFTRIIQHKNRVERLLLKSPSPTGENVKHLVTDE